MSGVHVHGTACNLQRTSERQGDHHKIIINVSGQRFTTWKQTLDVFPNTLLGSAERWKFYDEEKREFFFDRDPYIFRYILNYYRSRNLHTSPQDCPLAFKAELDFFGISFNEIHECCSDFTGCSESKNKHTHRFSERTSKALLLRLASDEETQRKVSCSSKGPTDSLPKESTIHSSESTNGCIVNGEADILTRLKTVPTASMCQHGKVNTGKWCTRVVKQPVEALQNNKELHPVFVPTASMCQHGKVNTGKWCTRVVKVPVEALQNNKELHPVFDIRRKGKKLFSKLNTVFYYLYGLFIIASVASTAAETVDCSEGVKCDVMYPTMFFALDTIFVIVFTLELLVRFFISPDKKAFVKDFMNIIDFLAILPYYLDLAIALVVGTTDILITLRVLRVCRILKLTRNSLRLQSLIVTLRNCLSDLVFLYLTMILAIVLFASCLFYMEKDENAKGFNSIPDSFWYTCVTMVTTG